MSEHASFQTLARLALTALLALAPLAAAAAPGDPFINFETPQVHPLDLSPDRNTLAAVNTADNSLLLFDVSNGNPRLRDRVSVGLDPVSVRFRSNTEAWVVNQISDSVSVVHVPTARVRATLATLDEPADVVFAGTPQRAFVSCSQENKVLVFEPDNLSKKPKRIAIQAEEPRAMAVSADGREVYVAIFESGNRSTVLAGGFNVDGIEVLPNIPSNVVSDPDGPYGGQNPPPNSGDGFEPAMAAGLPTPPPVSLIVKKDAAGRWMDDNGGDWTEFVSGSFASRSRRVQGWDVVDRDVAVINANSRRVTGYVEGLMNINMALAVNPASGTLAVVGTDATNEVRFEPVLNGTFLRVNLALADADGDAATVLDLNPHLTYETPRIARAERNRSIGDPRGIVWNAAGTRAWVSGMGSNNVVVVDASGARQGGTIEVGKGPTGLALDETMNRLYVLNRFSSSLSVVNTATGRRIRNVKFFDPTPGAIKKGRTHFYGTHETSGLGHVACASCHVDARTDRLAWDLGAPDGELKGNEDQNKTLIPGDDFEDWHPMKGPMTTQTMIDIVGKEPHHWRGDRDGIEEFADAFHGLLGDDARLPNGKMRKLEGFLAQTHFPPNPFRTFENLLPQRLKLKGHVRSGRFGPAGRRLPAGNARRGLELFRTRAIDGNVTCVRCHSLPTGAGTPAARTEGDTFEPIPAGPKGEQHLALIGDDASEQLGFKVPHLRNAYDKVGMDFTKRNSPAGFGFFHDGAVDSLARFVSAQVFDVQSDQEVADLVALILAFSGSDFDGREGEPPGSVSNDAHAAVGQQVTVAASNAPPRLRDMVTLAETGAVELVAKGRLAGAERGWLYDAASETFTPDRPSDPARSLTSLLSLAAPGSELTFTVVPSGSGERIGL